MSLNQREHAACTEIGGDKYIFSSTEDYVEETWLETGSGITLKKTGRSEGQSVIDKITFKAPLQPVLLPV